MSSNLWTAELCLHEAAVQHRLPRGGAPQLARVGRISPAQQRGEANQEADDPHHGYQQFRPEQSVTNIVLQGTVVCHRVQLLLLGRLFAIIYWIDEV